MAIDGKHRLVYFNRAAERMFRLPGAETLGSPLERFLPECGRSEDGAREPWLEPSGDTGNPARIYDAVRADGEAFPAEATISHGTVGQDPMWTLVLRDVSTRMASEKAGAQLIRDVDHRARNILSIVSSLVALTRGASHEAYVETLMGRISAISRAHGQIVQQQAQGVALGRLIEDELAAHAEPDKFSCVGPDLQLAQRAVQPISLLLHELASNALKYGALSVPDGHVYLTWENSGSGAIWLSWREAGGPPAMRPERPGFGSKLIQQTIESQLGGHYRAHWEEGGFGLMMSLPESVLKEATARRAGAPGMEMAATAEEALEEGEPGGTLLIVEDEPLLAMQLEQSLKSFGWSVLGIAGTIEDANRILATSPRPDAAILDVDLHGAPVFPLARSLRRSGIPFVFCTGYEDLELASEFSDDRAIRKPATVVQIVRALRDVVRSSSDQAARSNPL